MSNYPDDIRDFDNHPQSPFYEPPCCMECGEELEDDKCLHCDPVKDEEEKI